MEFQLFSLNGLMLCLGFFFAGIVDCTVGGGGLITVPVLMACGLPIQFVTGTNQFAAAPGAITSAANYARKGLAHKRITLISTPVAILFAIIGAKVNLMMPGQFIRMILLILIPLVAVLVLFKKDMGETNRVDELSDSGLILRSIMIGVFIGFYHGFIAVGSGVFFLMAFAIITKLDLVKALGTARIVVTSACVTSSITYAVTGNVYWPVIIPIIISFIMGNVIGSNLVLAKGAKLIRPMFIVVLVLLILKLFIG